MSRTKLLTHLDHAFMSIAKAISSGGGKRFCVSPAVDKVLMIIGLHDGSLNIKQLAAMLTVTSGGATQHVAILEDAGLAMRVPNAQDRREVFIQLTAKGTEALKAIRAQHHTLLDDIFQGLTEEELTTLVALIDKASETYKRRIHG